MRVRNLVVFSLLSAVAPMVTAQTCLPFIFPSLATCAGSNCKTLINVQPRGEARVLPDSRYGQDLGITFGEDSVFYLGDGGRLSFGNSGGIETLLNSSGTPECRAISSGLHAYTVDMSPGGWLVFSGNNRLDLSTQNVIALSEGSKISGRLVIQSEGRAGISATGGDMTLPNVDLDAAEGISLSGQGDMQIGNLQNQGTPADNGGINISAGGAVTIGIVDSNDDFSVTAGGTISIAEIRNAGSISLAVSPPGAGVIKIGGKQTTDNPVMCTPPDNCNGFELDGDTGGASSSCNTVSSDPDVERPDDCGGGAAGTGFLALCMAVLIGRRRIRRA